MSVQAPASDPLGAFTTVPVVDPLNLLDDVPPFERQSAEIQAVLQAVGNELQRLEAARRALINNFFPGTSDALLPLFEQLLGLPVDPPAGLPQRQSLVLATMRRLKGEGRGLDWQATITQLVGGGAWTYQEHDPANPSSPPPYTVAVRIPQAAAGIGWPFIRDLTPAHLAINEGYSDGFFVGVTNIGGKL
jgi:hypothetical protein